MKNPRGYYLSGLFLMAFLLFCMGSIQGNPIMVKYHNQEMTNSPPGQIVIAVIETPTYQVTVEPSVCTQIARGVSVPLRGLICETSNFINEKQISRFMCRIDTYSQINWQKSINTNNQLSDRGVNQYNQGVFRLDIGEINSLINIV
jgi:hypothetical protein